MLYPVLLVPGPVNLSLGVQEALRRPPLSPHQREYQGLQQQLLSELLAVYAMPEHLWQSVLMTGCAAQAVTAMLQSLVVVGQRGANTGIIVQGPLGERALAYLQQQQSTPLCLHLSDRALTPAVLGQWLSQHDQIQQLVLVHCEPDLGLMNDLQALAPVCREHEVHWLLDTSASFGAENLDFVHWPITAVAAGVDCCLHSAGGLAFVLGLRETLQASAATSAEVMPGMNDLAAWFDPSHWGGYWPSAAMHALAAALHELRDNGGWAARRRRYYRVQESTARLLGRYGMALRPPKGMLPAGVRSYQLPRLLTPDMFAQQLLRQGYVVAQGEAAVVSQSGPTNHITLATMGDLDELQISRLHQALEDILHPITISVGD